MKKILLPITSGLLLFFAIAIPKENHQLLQHQSEIEQLKFDRANLFFKETTQAHSAITICKGDSAHTFMKEMGEDVSSSSSQQQ